MLCKAEQDYQGFFQLRVFFKTSDYQYQWRFTTRKNCLTIGIDMFLGDMGK